MIDEALECWDRHQTIMMLLLEAMPRGGMAALPEGSRGRDVARQFAHICRVRQGWLIFHETGKRPQLPKTDKGKRPTKAQVRKELRNTGKEVRAHLEAVFRREAVIRMFGKSALQWMSYLISHESHHRGLILLSLKQSDMKLEDDVAIQGLWGTWIHKG